MQRIPGRHDPRYTEKLLDRVSATNRPTVEEYMTAKLAQGRKPSSVQRSVEVLARLDRFTNGTPFDAVDLATLTRLLQEYSRGRSPHSATGFAAMLKAFYSWRNDDECPKAIRRALKRATPPQQDNTVPISDAEFAALLEAAPETRRNDATSVRRLALLWLLWDGGFRVSEALAVRVGDVHFDDDGGAMVGMDPNAPDLKTGARSIYLVECAGALRLWLALHPRKEDPKAPLFANKAGDGRMIATNVNLMLRKLCKKAGVRTVHPHLFRHTRATRAADAGWNEAQMRPFFGWASASQIPSRYIHLRKRQLKENTDAFELEKDAAKGPGHVYVKK